MLPLSLAQEDHTDCKVAMSGLNCTRVRQVRTRCSKVNKELDYKTA
jgi:hypothetical protein